MASGFGVSAEILRMYELLKNNKTPEGIKDLKHCIRYFTMNIDIPNSEVVLGNVIVKNTENTKNHDEEAEECAKDLKAFVDTLPVKEGAYACFDFEFNTTEGFRNKVVFIQWVPDDTPVKLKMLLASSSDAVKKKLSGIPVIQASERDDLKREAIRQKVEKL